MLHYRRELYGINSYNHSCPRARACATFSAAEASYEGHVLLEGSWAVISGIMSPFVWVITIVFPLPQAPKP